MYFKGQCAIELTDRFDKLKELSRDATTFTERRMWYKQEQERPLFTEDMVHQRRHFVPQVSVNAFMLYDINMVTKLSNKIPFRLYDLLWIYYNNAFILHQNPDVRCFFNTYATLEWSLEWHFENA